ncbi:MAG: phosphoenolpyruvate-protein phosphotransferase PtsP, partial [Pseudomonadales bacterium]|nr:phosphoenolpyruvate-protein phosphotransferase PtsP [Pseudomonadales bacterium]
DFVSVGSNDLSQYLLALDRNNARVANRYDHVHPAVICEIERAVQSAREAGIPLSICGEMAADPVAVLLLLGMGVRSLSMSSAKLPKVKWLIRSISLPVAEQFLSEARQLDSTQQIRDAGKALLEAIGLRELCSG